MTTKSNLNQRIKTLEKSFEPLSHHAVLIYKDEADLQMQRANMGNRKFCICIPDNGRDNL